MPHVTASSYPIVLGGTEYRMSPLTDKDISELDNWLRARVVQTARDSLPANATPAEREEILGIALKQSRHLSWMTGEGAKMMSTLDGVSRVVWQSLRKEHPGVTHDQVRALVLDPRTIEYAMTVFKDLNYSTASTKNPPKGRKSRPQTK